MRAPVQVRFERLQRLIERLYDEAETGGIIVVEGPRDKESLRLMGIEGRILCLQSSRKNTLGFAEQFDSKSQVIVLTDFDREGVFLANRLARILNSQKIHANLTLWRELRGLTRSELRSIQELPRLYQRLQAEVYFHRPSGRELRRYF